MDILVFLAFLVLLHHGCVMTCFSFTLLFLFVNSLLKLWVSTMLSQLLGYFILSFIVSINNIFDEESNHTRSLLFSFCTLVISKNYSFNIYVINYHILSWFFAKKNYTVIRSEQIVILFPGQGAQYVGMGNMLINCPPAKRLFDQSSEILGYDLLKLCSEGPKTKLLSNISALRIVHVRCQAMHECNQLIRSGMLTVFRFNIHGIMYLGIIIRTFVFLHREKGEMDICEIANYLFCGVTMLFKLVIRLCINFSLYYIYLNIFYNINKIPNQIQQLLYRKHQVILIYQTKFPLHIVVNFILIMQDYKFPRFVEVGPGRQLGTMLLQVSKKAYHYSC
uniref:PKS_AT domain-containing protein n=1 Tax=Heterorhabditis bacteriophora TaxID=37862 RepID=A0A1I7X5R2_HETBA